LPPNSETIHPSGVPGSIKLVVFDCDGVMFHSEKANLAFYQEVLRRAGVPPLPDDARTAAHAMASVQLFERYFGEQPELLARIKTTAGKTPYTPFFELMTPRAGLFEVLGELRQTAGYAIAMATNRSATFEELLERFELAHLFDYAVGARGAIRPKPHPDMLIDCSERFRVSPAEIVFVGDQPSDAECARRAGTRFVGIGAVAEQCETAVQRLCELPALLAGLSSD